MRIIGHGIDLVDCRRIERILREHDQRFLDRVFTPAEQEYCRRFHLQAERLAGRFAVKEAVMKMLGTGWSGIVTWKDIETTNDPAGKPMVRLTGEVARLAAQQGINHVLVSITHTKGLAMASVIGLGE